MLHDTEHIEDWHPGRNRDARHNVDARACLAAFEMGMPQDVEEFSMFVFPI